MCEELPDTVIYSSPSRQSVSAVSITRRKSSPTRKTYTPQFSEMATVSIRRLAWAMGATMPAAVNRIVKLLPQVFPSVFVCSHCRDNSKCQACIFSQGISEQEKIPVYL
jgi:hypothetical protein